MDNQIITPFLNILQNFSAESVSIILFAICMVSILLLFRIFGQSGLYIYNIVALLAANIQVLRAVKFELSTEPVALGTVVFASTYLCSDILTEHYGKESAKKGVWYCFAAQILMTLFMILAVGYPKLTEEFVLRPEFQALQFAEDALAFLFTPSPRLLFASLLAFLLSQLNDIWIFQSLNKFTRGKWLWLRTNIASSISAVVDTVLFSTLAWVILAPQPLSFSTLFLTYILGTLITRILIGFFTTPIMYLSYWARPISMRPRYG